MRTTLDIADDVLLAATEIARREKTTVGRMISELARRGLTVTAPTVPGHAGLGAAEFFGFRPLPARGVVVTDDLIDRLGECETY